MSMALTKTIHLGEISVEVRELTVGEIRHLLKMMAEGDSSDVISSTLLPEISLTELALMTDLDVDQLDDLAPSQLRKVFEATREVNTDFFVLRERIVEVGKQVLGKLSEGSKETLVP